jgi:exoribonuclease R
MKEPVRSQLLDLLSATDGEGGIEPTRAQASQTVLYPDVSIRFPFTSSRTDTILDTVSSHRYSHLWRKGWDITSRSLRGQPLQLPRGVSPQFNITDPYNDFCAQGSINTPAFTTPVLLIGRANMNRAVNGDIVVIEVFPESEWRAPADEIVDQEGMSFIPVIPCLLYAALSRFLT